MAEEIKETPEQAAISAMSKQIVAIRKAIDENKTLLKSIAANASDDDSTDVSSVMSSGEHRVASEPDRTSFRPKWLAGHTTLNVGAGVFGITGVGAWETAATDVALSGSPCYVYLYQVKASRATAVAANSMATLPVTTATEYRYPLFKLTANGGIYSITQDMRYGKWIGSAL